MLIYLRQTPSIKLPFGSDCWDCRYVCRHPAGYSDWVRASLRFTNKFLNIANKNSPPKTKACSLSCCMMYSCQSSVWFFATRGWLSDLSSLGNARKDASNGSIQNPSIHPSTYLIRSANKVPLFQIKEHVYATVGFYSTLHQLLLMLVLKDIWTYKFTMKWRSVSRVQS